MLRMPVESKPYILAEKNAWLLQVHDMEDQLRTRVFGHPTISDLVSMGNDIPPKKLGQEPVHVGITIACQLSVRERADTLQ